jgi:hypothetical protein
MKKLIFLLLLIPCTLFGQGTLSPGLIEQSGTIWATSMTDPKLIQPSGLMWYYEYKDPNLPDAPVIIFLHGSGEKSDTPNLGKIQKQGLPKLLKAAGMSYLPGFTVLCPQQVTGRWGYNPEIIKFLQYVKSNYKSEYRLLTGLSMGSDGSWDGSYQSDDKLVTAIVPVSGKGDYNLAKKTASKKIYVWAIHGKSDTSVPTSDGLRPVNGMNSVGANPKPIWTLINGAHNSVCWDVAFSIEDQPQLGNTTIYKWFKSLLPKEQPTTGIFIDGIWQGETECDFNGLHIEYRN